WSGRLYQYANRYAHLYFLREICKVDAYLIFVYVTGDQDVAGPATVDEWKAAITVAKSILGIGTRHRLSPYVADVFFKKTELESVSSSSASSVTVRRAGEADAAIVSAPNADGQAV